MPFPTEIDEGLFRDTDAREADIHPLSATSQPVPDWM